jgi:ArsR family transcriptional regulator
MMNQSVQVIESGTASARRTCDPTLYLRIQSDHAETLAEAFKALSHPVRVQILDLISQGGGEACGCDIERHFDLTQPTISHHLKVLRDAGLITSEPRGVWVHHHVNAKMVNSMQALLATMHNQG